MSVGALVLAGSGVGTRGTIGIGSVEYTSKRISPSSLVNIEKFGDNGSVIGCACGTSAASKPCAILRKPASGT